MEKILEKMKMKKVIPYLAIVLILIIGFILLRYMGWTIMGNDQPVPATSSNVVEISNADTMTIPPANTYDATHSV